MQEHIIFQKQDNNTVRVVPLTDVFEFTMTTEPTKEELNILHSYGFFLKVYFIQDNCKYYIFRKKIKN